MFFLAFAVLTLITGASAVAETPVARLYLQETGVYRLSFEDLQQSGFASEAFASAELGLEHAGEPVPLWVEDGGDGRFGPGDHLEFIGRRLPGEGKYFFEHSRYNVYWLQLDAARAARMQPIAPLGETAAPRRALWRRQHLELDRLMIRLSAAEMREDESSDLWFWAKLSHVDEEPFGVDLDLSDRALQSDRPLALKVRLRGLSRVKRGSDGVPHHRVDAYLGGEFLAHVEWDGRTVADLEVEVPAARLADSMRLELKVPERLGGDGEQALVDVVMLDHIELRYPHAGTPPEDQVVIELASGDDGAVELELDGPIIAYGSRGSRFETDSSGSMLLPLPAEEAELLLVNGSSFGHLDRIEIDRPSKLADTDRQSDYLILSHPHLIDAVRPLAEAHRRRGLAVEVIDIQDVYDEFGHGIVDPAAIRDFLAHAYHRWSEPRPRFVLLVGDASWDLRNDEADDANYANWTDRQLLHGERFVARRMTPYDTSSSPQHRNLIPTWIYASGQGHSASDNGFVTVDGDDLYPDLAIGRLPVVEPEEVTAIVDKTVRYLERPEVGPWRRNILWITNESSSFQKTSDYHAARLDERGFQAHRVYPQASEASNEHHQASLLQALDLGQLLVHFYGHGGRHIWRTGPPDFKKNHDLFTLEHVEQLAPSGRLPLILSMTCYSAPFDHPSADSIGEKFLRVPGRGAIGVLAASWRNSPSRRFINELMEQLTTPGTPIGVAIQRAKIVSKSRDMVEMYNLLGDPAVELALPAASIELEPEFTGDKVRVRASLPAQTFTGRALIDGLDTDGNVLTERRAKIVNGQLQTRLPLKKISPERLVTLRVYAWDPEAGTDALGVWRRGQDPSDGARSTPAAASERP